MTQNTEQSGSVDLLKTTDASVWAAQFNATAVQLGYSSMDVGWLVGWFANAMGVAELRVKASTTLSAELNKAAEARGAEEQRRKDGGGSEKIIPRVDAAIVHAALNLTEEQKKLPEWIHSNPETGERSLGRWPKGVSEPNSPYVRCDLALRPANVAALEAEIAALKEAEQLARADAAASKARVKVLETAVRDVLAHESAWKDLLASVDPDDGGYVAHEQAAYGRDMTLLRAALTREGGV